MLNNTIAKFYLINLYTSIIFKIFLSKKALFIFYINCNIIKKKIIKIIILDLYIKKNICKSNIFIIVKYWNFFIL